MRLFCWWVGEQSAAAAAKEEDSKKLAEVTHNMRKAYEENVEFEGQVRISPAATAAAAAVPKGGK